MKKITFLIFAFLLPFLLTAQQGFQTITNLNAVPVSTDTGEKPQAKVWFYAGKHWAVLPNSSGTHLWRLDGITWTNVLRLSTRTSSKADTKMVGNAAHILLFQGASSQLVSVEYSEQLGTYQLWSKRTSTVGLNLQTTTKTATIDIDGNARMWLAYNGSNNIMVSWSDSPYNNWSSPITLATVNSDDICAVIALPGKVGVFWSDQNTKRFGFRTHTDGDNPNNWSVNEIPASQSALNIGYGMADDHMNLAVASDGTLYSAVKTGYDRIGYPTIALLVRRPSGLWDDLYEVSGGGTRPIVILNEELNKVRVIFPEKNGGGVMYYRESSTTNISFGPELRLMNGSSNNPTSSKDNFTSEVVVLASTSTHAVGVLATEGNLSTELLPPVLSSPTNLSTNISTSPILSWNPSTGAQNYELQVSTQENFSTLAFHQNALMSTFVTVSGLSNNTTYFWRTRAKNSEKQSDWSTVWSFTTVPVSSGSTLIAHWKMNEGSGTTLMDEADYGNHGVISGSPTWVTGVDGQALRFNGSNQYATVEDNNSIDIAGAVTIAMWVKPEKRATQYLIKKAAHNSVDGYELALSNPGQFFFRFNQKSSGDTYRLNSNVNYPTSGDTWMHVAATFNGTTIKLFINGIEDNSTTFSSASSIGINALPLSIGAESDGFRGLQGAIDDVRIYNIALSASEIYELANLTTTPPVAGIPLQIAPPNLAVDVETSPNLSWSPAEGVETYSVQVSSNSNFSNPVFNQTGILETSVLVSSLAERTSYYWRVRGVNAQGQSDWSQVWSFTTATGPVAVSVPVLISPNNAATGVAIQPTLSWSPAQGANNYSVQVAANSNFLNPIFDQTGIVGTSIMVSPLLHGTSYYWRVRGVSDTGQSDWSQVWNFTTVPVSSGSALIAHWKMNEGGGSVLIDDTSYGNHGVISGSPTWISGVDGQAVRFNGSNQYATVQDNNSIDLAGAVSIAMWIKPEKKATQYLIKKAAHNSINGYELALSNPGKVFFRFNQNSSGDTYRLDSNINYPTTGNTWMHIAATYNGTSIKIFINGIEDKSVTFTTTASIGINELPLSIGAESDGFRGLQGAMDDVRVYNVALSASEIYALANPQSPPPVADIPLQIAPQNLEVSVETSPTLSWNSAEGADTYSVQVSANSNFSNPVFNQTGIVGTSVLVNTLSEGTVYYWRVRGVNAASQSDWSQVWSFTTITTPVAVAVPVLLSPANAATGVVLTPTLSWNSAEGADTYSIEVAANSNFSNLVFNQTGIVETSVKVSSLAEGTSYYWRIRGVNSTGQSDWSQVWNFTTVTPPVAVAVPVLLSPANAATGVATQPALSWNSAEGAETYSVEVAANSNFSNLVFNQTGIVGTSVLVNILSEGTLYYWRVRGVNSTGQSEWSQVWNFTVLSQDPVSVLRALWKMEEGSGSILVDASEFGNNATITGNASRVLGVEGMAIQFNGNQYATVENSSSLNFTQSITIAAWIKPSAKGNQVLVRKTDNSGANGFELALAPNGRISFQVNQTSNKFFSTANYPTNGNTWMHIAATFDGSVMKIFINGVENSSKTISPGSLNINNWPLFIGAAAGGSNSYRGAMDEVYIYSVALQNSEISNLRNGGSSIRLASNSIKNSNSETGVQNPIIEEFKEEFFAAPNPLSSTTSIYLSFSRDMEYSMTLFDGKGAKIKEIAQGDAKARENYKFDFDGSSLPDGIYLLRLQNSAGETKTIRLLSRK